MHSFVVPEDAQSLLYLNGFAEKPEWNPPLRFWGEVLEAFEDLLLDKEPDLKGVKPPRFTRDVHF